MSDDRERRREEDLQADEERRQEKNRAERDRELEHEKREEEKERSYRTGYTDSDNGIPSWIYFLLGLLFAIAALAIIWFFTGSRRTTEEAPGQVIYSDRTWVATGEPVNLDDAEVVRIGTVNGRPLYARRSDRQPYTIIYIRESGDTYQSYQTEEPAVEPSPQPSPQPSSQPSAEEIARKRADNLPAEVSIASANWTKKELAESNNLDLERYGTYTVSGYNVYKEVQQPENMLSSIYVGVGAGMYVRYERKSTGQSN